MLSAECLSHSASSFSTGCFTFSFGLKVALLHQLRSPETVARNCRLKAAERESPRKSCADIQCQPQVQCQAKRTSYLARRRVTVLLDLFLFACGPDVRRPTREPVNSRKITEITEISELKIVPISLLAVELCKTIHRIASPGIALGCHTVHWTSSPACSVACSQIAHHSPILPFSLFATLRPIPRTASVTLNGRICCEPLKQAAAPAEGVRTHWADC